MILLGLFHYIKSKAIGRFSTLVNTTKPIELMSSHKKKECPSCAMEIDIKAEDCPICGYEFPKSSPLLTWVAVLLIVALLLLFIF